MIAKLIKCIKHYLEYKSNPRYVIMQGIQIDNRAIMFLGARPCEPKDRRRELDIHGYVDESAQRLKISFENQELTYWKSNRYKIIWTFKELMYWRRMLPNNNSKCLEKTNGKWHTIEKDLS